MTPGLSNYWEGAGEKSGERIVTGMENNKKREEKNISWVLTTIAARNSHPFLFFVDSLPCSSIPLRAP